MQVHKEELMLDSMYRRDEECIVRFWYDFAHLLIKGINLVYDSYYICERLNSNRFTPLCA